MRSWPLRQTPRPDTCCRSWYFCQQPDGVGGFEFVVALAALELLAVDVRPVVDDTRGQVAVAGELDFDLVEPVVAVFGFDIDDAEFVAQELFVVVRV